MMSETSRHGNQKGGLSDGMKFVKQGEDENEDGLSTIEVTPNQKFDRLDQTLFLNSANPELEHGADISSRYGSSTNSSFSLGGGRPVPARKIVSPTPKGEPFSLNALFAGFSKWTSAGERSGDSYAGDVSPVSILESSAYGNSPSHLKRRIVTFKNPCEYIFDGADGIDAREFQDFLHDDEGGSSRIPVLCLVDYGMRGEYASDLWVLFHNTIRRELFDTFEIVGIVRQNYLSLRYSDICKLRKWWRFFVVIWEEYILYEKRLLDPLIRKISVVDGRSDILNKGLRPLRETREWLGLKMEEITSYIEEFEKLPAGRALCLICKNVDSYADKMMGYFVGQESLLPPYVESYHGEDIKNTIESLLMERIRKSDYFAEILVCMIRWMGSVQGFYHMKSQCKEREKWLCTHLSWFERQKIGTFFRRYELSQGNILLSFRQLRKTKN